MLIFLMTIEQMNWVKLRFSLEYIRMAEFTKSLDKVYQLAESHPGFIWRIPDNQSELQLADIGFDKLISSTVSVWDNLGSLKYILYSSSSTYIYCNALILSWDDLET